MENDKTQIASCFYSLDLIYSRTYGKQPIIWFIGRKPLPCALEQIACIREKLLYPIHFSGKFWNKNSGSSISSNRFIRYVSFDSVYCHTHAVKYSPRGHLNSINGSDINSRHKKRINWVLFINVVPGNTELNTANNYVNINDRYISINVHYVISSHYANKI